MKKIIVFTFLGFLMSIPSTFALGADFFSNGGAPLSPYDPMIQMRNWVLADLQEDHRYFSPTYLHPWMSYGDISAYGWNSFSQYSWSIYSNFGSNSSSLYPDEQTQKALINMGLPPFKRYEGFLSFN